VIFCLLVPTTSHGNPIWRMYYKVKDHTGIPWEKKMIGLPLVSCRDGVCVGFVLDKHHQDNFDKHASWHASPPL
jgi:hypothetical protein